MVIVHQINTYIRYWIKWHVC